MGSLTIKRIEAEMSAARKAKKARWLRDGERLRLHIVPRGEKVNAAWTLRFRIAGRTRDMGLGAFPTVSLSTARDEARRCGKLISAGTDPIEDREKGRTEERAARRKALNFHQCAENYIEAHEAEWRNPKHRQQWRNTLRDYAYPKIGDRPVAAVDVDDVLSVVEPIWTKLPETAHRVRQRIEAVLGDARARGLRSGENPAALARSILSKRRKVAPVKHHSAMPYTELPAFMKKLRDEQPGTGAVALRFLIHCASRTGEVIGATFDEVDFETRLWTIDGSRMKSGQTHRQPLSDQALAILEKIGKREGLVFPGAKVGKPLSNMAMLQLMRRMELSHFVVHGFRASFKTWAAEATSYPAELAELSLAHTVSSIASRVEASYMRTDLLEKRRQLMQAWSNFVEPRAA